MHSISNNQLMSLTKHYKSNGACPPRSKSGGRRQNTKAFSNTDVWRIVNFISSYAEDHGVVIPGRVAGVKCDDTRVRLLPSKENRSRIWRQYKQTMETTNASRMAEGKNYFWQEGKKNYP